ncbi:MAG: DUF3098 domain-containing protein [Prevotella sp.]|nr:DUF3098 domain-containing protein [Prevotella sp.]
MPTNSKKTESHNIFDRTNYAIILLACVTITIGFMLMAGDGSTESYFQEDIFSTRRIVIAPIVCLTGYIAIIVGILWKHE